MKKIFLFVIILTAVFCVSTTAFAMTDAERQTLIAQIQQQIAQLTAELNQMLAQQQGTSTWCHTFNTDLGYANSGSDEVMQLHLALQQQNISYSPDTINVYSTGTSLAVAQFQAKYNISPQLGYTGPLTRTKLNQLYGCTSTTNTNTNTNVCNPDWSCTSFGSCSNGAQTRSCYDTNYCGVNTNKPATTQTCTVDGDTNNNNTNTNCTPSWTCSGFGSCSNGVQTQTCTDSNTCGITTDKPATTQNCSAPPTVDLKINGGDNSVSTSINKPAILSWTSTNASSCTASGDWSGTKSSSGSVSTSNITSSTTYTITCTGPGGTATDTVTANPSSAVSVDLKINNSDGPVSILNNTITLSWSSANTSSCAISGQTKAIFGLETIVVPVTSASVGTSLTIEITCTGSGGTATDSVVANWTQGVATVDMDINGQTEAASFGLVTFDNSFAGSHYFVLNWSAANTDSCTISTTCTQGSTISGYSIPINFCQQGILDSSSELSGSVPAIGSKLVNIDLSQTSYITTGMSTPWSYKMSLNKKYTITCTGSGGTATKQITAQMKFNGPQPAVKCTKDSDCGSCFSSRFGTIIPYCQSPNTIYATCTSTEGYGTSCPASCTAGDYQCGNWSACTNGQQTRTCNLTNYQCIGNDGKPATTQNCNTSQSPVVDIKINNSDGPITVGSGTPVTWTWASTNATSCTSTFDVRSTLNGSVSTNSVQLSSAGTYTFTCSNANGVTTDSVVLNITPSSSPALTPTVDLKASISGINNGALSDGPLNFPSNNASIAPTLTLSWVSTNATSCTAVNGWTQPALSGSTNPVLPAAQMTYTIICAGANGTTATDSVTISPRSMLWVDIKAAGQGNYTDGPLSVASGTPVGLKWVSTDPTLSATCTASGSWIGSKLRMTSETLTPPAGQQTYTITCIDNTGARVSDSVVVNVSGTSTGVSPTAPTLNFTYDGSWSTNAYSSISWNGTNISSCTASGAWSGSKNISGIEYIGLVTEPQSSYKTYTITCSNTLGETITKSVFAPPPIGQGTITPGSVTVDMKANSSNGPITLAPGTNVTLSWTSSGATSCVASGAWSGIKSTSGSLPVFSPTRGESQYTLVCGDNSNHAASDWVVIKSSSTLIPLSLNNLQNQIASISSAIVNLISQLKK